MRRRGESPIPRDSPGSSRVPRNLQDLGEEVLDRSSSRFEQELDLVSYVPRYLRTYGRYHPSCCSVYIDSDLAINSDLHVQLATFTTPS
jgi:hypothetical protein